MKNVKGFEQPNILYSFVSVSVQFLFSHSLEFSMKLLYVIFSSV